jgi:hypothetical protein
LGERIGDIAPIVRQPSLDIHALTGPKGSPSAPSSYGVKSL